MSIQPWRRSINLPGVEHKAPIPLACRIGNLVFTSAIMGTDPQLGKLAEGMQAQVSLAFRHLDGVLEQAGASVADIGRLTVYLSDDSGRDAVNQEWLQRFPDAADRPARHIVIKQLPGGMLAQLEAIAVLKSDTP